jgi:outer membrane protein assembly factor BamB
VIYPGWRWGSWGPDFRSALLAIDGAFVRGDVEIHVQARDWDRHGHATDPAYDALVLQVVFDLDNAPPPVRHDGVPIPTVRLSSALDVPVDQLLRRHSQDRLDLCKLERSPAVLLEGRIATPHHPDTQPSPLRQALTPVRYAISRRETASILKINHYDPATGKELWRFNTIPGPGEFGHDTWEGDSWTHGGGPLWTHPAVDSQLGMVYIPVGNASPDQDGSERGGDNLFTASILALDVKTGAYKWHFQEVHHDVWDYDNPLAPVLADVRYQGQPRKILIHGGKTGLTYILDRTNGKPLIGIEERPVPQNPANKTAKTQPFPIGDSPVPYCPESGSVAAGALSSCVFGAFRPDQPVVMTPGTQGGLNWAPVTFSPQTNLFYVPASLINSQFASGFSRPGGQPRAGTLSAMDPTTNRIVWQVRTKYPLGTGSGLLSTASGLLIGGQSDGDLVIYDIRNGNELWRFQTGAGADAPVATYEVNGEQYIAILSSGNSFQLSAQGDNLWAFKLGGTVKPLPAPEPPPTLQPTGGRRGGGGGQAGLATRSDARGSN